MPIPAAARQFARELKLRINNNPVWLTRYILAPGNGFSSDASWQFTDSFKADLSDERRNQWFAFTSDGTTAKRIYTITFPATEVTVDPVAGQMITIATLDGTDMGQLRINFCNPLRWHGNVYAWQLTAEVSP